MVERLRQGPWIFNQEQKIANSLAVVSVLIKELRVFFYFVSNETMRNCKKIQVKILGNNNANPKEVREIWTKLFDMLRTPKSIFEEQKEFSEKIKAGSEG